MIVGSKSDDIMCNLCGIIIADFLKECGVGVVRQMGCGPSQF